MRLLAFEGMPGSGKTTFLSGVSNEQILVIGETFLEPEMPLVQQRQLTNRYLKMEIEKSILVNKFQSSYKIGVLDRSYISIAAFCYAKAQSNGTRDSLKDYHSVVHEIMILIEQGDIIEPDEVLIFLCSIETSLGRRANTRNKNLYQPWFDNTFLRYLHEYYTSQKWHEIFKGSIFFVATDELSTTEMTEIVNDIIKL